MSAPVVTARQTPAGIALEDGFPTLLAFERDPNVSLWEKAVTPPGWDGGDAIDTTTMHNQSLRTFAPRQLKTLTEISFTAAYDPVAMTQIGDLINKNGSITVHIPDGTTISFWGYLKGFVPNENTEGAQPEAACTIVPTNRDEDGVEQGPVVVEVAGT